MSLQDRQSGASLACQLVARFKATFDGVPEWAWPFKPSIPFIGRNYSPGSGLLIYASAENLSWMAHEQPSSRFTSEDAWNRYRVQFEKVGENSSDFFPDIGIAPVNNGGLLSAGLLVTKCLGLPSPSHPREFLETVAVSNWCKYSIRAGTNRDYITDIQKLTASLPFVVGELATLRPAVVLIHTRVWEHPILRAAMWGACPSAKFIPVPQCNPRVVNIHLANFADAGKKLRRQFINTPLTRWMGHLRGFTDPHPWRYMAFVNNTLRLPSTTNE